jgi:hypothetical protein
MLAVVVELEAVQAVQAARAVVVLVQLVLVLELLEQQTLVVVVVVLEVMGGLILAWVLLAVQELLFFVTHQTTTWLQQAEQSVTSVVTRFTRSPLQVITRWWSHE